VLDQQGLEMTGSAEAVAAYDRAVEHLVRFRIDVLEAVVAAVRDPSSVMGRVLSAYLALLSTEGADVARAAAVLGSIGDDRPLVERERAHRSVVERWVAGDLRGSGALLDRLSVEYPRDLLALYVGHQIDFLTGDAANLRDRIGRSLSAWSTDDPAFGFLLGMHAFGLEECNQYGRAADAGLAALAAHPEDVWGLHAVAHTYEMQGQVRDGLGFFDDRRPDWSGENFLRVHNSWHYALLALEGDDATGALAIYDEVLHPPGARDVAYELVDSASLLWRLELDGTPLGARWSPLADAWRRVLIPGFYPFNDLHATMAYVGAGDLDEARRVVAALERSVEAADPAAAGRQRATEVGRAVCAGLVCFATADFDGALESLLSVRGFVQACGGSHAQRDVVERTLLEAAIRAGRHDLARALLSERLSLRESSAYAWRKRAELLARLGDPVGARRAEARAAALASAAAATRG